MSYNISNWRTIEIDECMFFENWGHKQVTVVWIVSDWDTQYPITMYATDHLDYETLKNMATCEFSPIANVVKADACEWVKQHIITELDAMEWDLFANRNV